ncbi:unnamed protein product [Zymoseptoria tritici ST99CH_1E4]|uniref:XPG-I domain-containing protein n=2 Tax=Zymoseptoria tritici TaxID=1047171 RepID=A0A2H1GAU8_ZYMTR|nr:unnamed protein product [Zymoseptoria tritici ST99CH_1E4]
MGISGIFKELGPGQRISLVKLAADHYAAHDRPFRLAIDISIWLFQIQAGKGGSNPALRTFYYRLLRLLTHNIHPLFVFDGPNKPTFKRNKKVGGPGVRVASVPEFLAKQLLKQFGFPWHVAPGEAEAECALLQREGIVDAVLSEDVDTLMFGSGVTLKSWTAESSQKTPTHVTVYRAEETTARSGLDTQGMILVALMSGGDYIVEGIPGCGPKVACDAARAGFGKELCDLAARKDAMGLRAWRERLQHEIKTNESKLFSRKNSKLVIPEDFPNREVLGYYTHPCVSTADKLAKLKDSLAWDQDIDFAALRGFTADAFDWRCLGGAKKFIRNLAPAMLVRQLRLRSDEPTPFETETQEAQERSLISAIHGKRNHATTDGELEYRVSFIPQNFVPIDLSTEDPDDDFVPAGGAEEQSETENDWAALPDSTQPVEEDEEEPSSPTKKRSFKPYFPDQPEKLWMLRTFLKVGCPLLVEVYENPPRDAKSFFKARRQAKEAGKGDSSQPKKKTTRKKKTADMPANALLAFTSVVKSSQGALTSSQSSQGREPLKAMTTANRTIPPSKTSGPSVIELDDDDTTEAPAFKRPSTSLFQVPSSSIGARSTASDEEEEEATPRPNIKKSVPKRKPDTRPVATQQPSEASADVSRTPQRRKRPAPSLQSSPAASQRTINSYFSPSPLRSAPRISMRDQLADVVNLISSPAAVPNFPSQARTPTPSTQRVAADDYDLVTLPESVTRRRQRGPLKRAKTSPAIFVADDELDADLHLDSLPLERSFSSTDLGNVLSTQIVETLDLAGNSSPVVSRTRYTETPVLGTATRPPSRTEPLQSSRSVATMRQPGKQSRSAAERQTPPASTTSKTIDKKLSAIRRSPRQVAQQEQIKRRIKLRQSLQGAWTEVEAETMDLSGITPPANVRQGRGNARGWRKSGVEILDLTGA